MQEILILKSAPIGAELLKRHMDGTWPSQPLSVESGEVMLESIGFGFLLAAAYPGRLAWELIRSDVPTVIHDNRWLCSTGSQTS